MVSDRLRTDVVLQFGEWRRSLVRAVITGSVGCLVLQVVDALGQLPSRVTTPVWWVRAVLMLATAAAGSCLLADRIRTDDHERELWVPVTVASVVLTVGLAGQLIVGMVEQVTGDGSTSWQALPLVLAIVVACPAIYAGIIRWNRFATAIAGPSDWLNGLSAVGVATAAGNLLLVGGDRQLAGAPWWEVQGWLLGTAVSVVLVGTALTAAKISGLTHDPRPWLITGALGVVAISQVSADPHRLPLVNGSWAQAGWLLVVPVVAVLSTRRAVPAVPQPARPMSSAVGMMVVLVACTAILAIDTEVAHGAYARVSAWYAIVAFAGASAHAIRMIRDLSLLAESRQEARTDALTGAANRRALMSQLDDAVAGNDNWCLLLLNLDGFKEVNDRHGHGVGDEFLRELARRMQPLVPEDGLLARLGADEFAIVSPATTVTAAGLADQLIDVTSAPIVVGDVRLQLGVSIGVSALRRDGGAQPEEIDGGELLRRADLAMYVAKQTGAGYSFYHPSVDADRRERQQRLEELTEVLSDAAPPEVRKQLVVFYQSKHDPASGALVGAEALVRWQHPRVGMLGPDAFVELAEEHGLMGRLTTAVLQEACRQARRWSSQGPDIRISVNLSSSSLSDPDFLPVLDAALTESGLDPRWLTLEITETTLMTDPEWSLDTTRQIVGRGIGVSIDDYGTGYSSLAYLRNLPATELKLDRSITSEVATDSRAAAIIAGTVELAHRLGLRVVAEGVEDEAMLTALHALGCDEVQGYLYGKPGPPEQIAALLAQQPSPARIAIVK